jgi:hypothetical protein
MQVHKTYIKKNPGEPAKYVRDNINWYDPTGMQLQKKLHHCFKISGENNLKSNNHLGANQKDL